MKAYFIRRLLLVIPTFLGITVMVFAVTRFVPGGPVERMIAEARSQQTGMASADQAQPLSESQIQELNAYYGLDKPMLQSYALWLGKVMRGDLGTSTRYYDPVLEMILARVPVSLYFGLISLVMVYGVCIPLGMAKAVRHNSRFDNISSLLVFTGYAIPGWVIGVLLLLLFASRWEFFPLGGFVGDFYDELGTWGKVKDVVWHTVLPVVSYMAGSFAVMTMLMKNTLMDNLAADYMRTAVAKGLPFKKAVFRHALRNSLIPMATSFGSNISLILTGSFLIEKVFNIDGMGLLGYESVVERDYPVVLGVLVISSLLFLIGNILSDICVAFTDPRVTFE